MLLSLLITLHIHNLNVHICRYGEGTGDIVLTQVQCSVDDNHILRCTAMGISRLTSDCADHTKDVGIVCCKHNYNFVVFMYCLWVNHNSRAQEMVQQLRQDLTTFDCWVFKETVLLVLQIACFSFLQIDIIIKHSHNPN